MKRYLSILLALLLLVTAAGTAFAEEKPKVYSFGDYTYILLEDETAEIVGYKGRNTQIVIPAKVDGVSVTSIGAEVFKENKRLISVTIPAGVTSIGYLAFDECINLSYVSIPDSVTTIGNSAFAFCGRLTSLVIPQKVTSIGVTAFAACDHMRTIIIPDSVTSIGENAFIFCNKMTCIVGRNSYAQQYCTENDLTYTCGW